MRRDLMAPEGIPVRAGAAVTRFPTDFVPPHLGIVLQVHDQPWGYTARVLLIDDGRRNTSQVLENVMVCAGSSLGALSAGIARPTASTIDPLRPDQKEQLAREGYLPFDLTFDALDGDWCVINYLGGNEQKPFIACFWPNPNRRVLETADWPVPRWRIRLCAEKLREKVAAVAGDIPVDFLLAWIDHESGGMVNVCTGSTDGTVEGAHPAGTPPDLGDRASRDAQPINGACVRRPAPRTQTSHLDEHGYFQISRQESLGALGLSLEAHFELGRNHDFSIAQGLRLVRHYQGIANEVLRTAGLPWQPATMPASYWTFVKLLHGAGSGAAPATLRAVLQEMRPRSPSGWPDVFRAAAQRISTGGLQDTGLPPATLLRTLRNASAVGSVLAAPGSGEPGASATVYQAHLAGTRIAVDRKGNIAVSTATAGLIPAATAAPPDATGGGSRAPLSGGTITIDLKAGEKLRVVSGGEPVLTVTHDGQGPRLKLGRRGDAPWEQTVLGRQLVAFFNEQFLPPLLAKLAAIENQFADFYVNEYAQHQHLTAWGPTPPGPSLPVANPLTATFQDAAPSSPPALGPGQRMPPPAPVASDKKTVRGTLPEMIDEELLSPVLCLPERGLPEMATGQDEEA